MSKTIVFNTGRRYTEQGQIVTATLHDDGVVTFYDHSRMVDGEFTLHVGDFDQETVMFMYDNNGYRSTTRSWEDGMLEGGCNTKREV